MPPPPLKLLKSSTTEKEQTIEQLLIECGFNETLECFRNERNRMSRLPTEVGEKGNFIEKRGDGWCCSFCEKTFTTKGSAKRHLVSTHATDSKQFECPRCTSKFARRDDLYTHLRRMHAANDLVESMIEEHKAELKGEHKGGGMGTLMSVISHNEHLDVLLPSGTTICRPLAVDVSSTAAKEPAKAARACRTSKCNHWRVMHDGHEDILVNGALHHKNEEGEWECHGELGSLEDFEFLLTSAEAIEDNSAASAYQPATASAYQPGTASKLVDGSMSQLGHFSRSDAHCLELKHDDKDGHEFSLDDFDFFLTGHDHQSIAHKQTVESLLLPGGSVFSRRVSLTAPRHPARNWSGEDHRHSAACGHSRVRHGNHYDFLVGNVIENETGDCIMHGTVILEQNDSATLSYVVSALTSEQHAAAADNINANGVTFAQ